MASVDLETGTISPKLNTLMSNICERGPLRSDSQSIHWQFCFTLGGRTIVTLYNKHIKKWGYLGTPKTAEKHKHYRGVGSFRDRASTAQTCCLPDKTYYTRIISNCKQFSFKIFYSRCRQVDVGIEVLSTLGSWRHRARVTDALCALLVAYVAALAFGKTNS